MSGETGEVMRALAAGWLANWRWGQESLAAAALWRRLLQGGRGTGGGEAERAVSWQQLAALLGAGAACEEDGSRKAGSKAGQAGRLDLQTARSRSIGAGKTAARRAASLSRLQSAGMAGILGGGDYEAVDSDSGSKAGGLAAAGDKSEGQRKFVQAAMEQVLAGRQRAAEIDLEEAVLDKSFLNKEILNEHGIEMLTAILADEAAGAEALQPGEPAAERTAKGRDVGVKSRRQAAVEASGLGVAEAGFGRGVSEQELAGLLFGGWEGTATEAADIGGAGALWDLSLSSEAGIKAEPGLAGWLEQTDDKGCIADSGDEGSALGLNLEQLTEAVAERLRDELEAALCSRGWL